VKTGEVKRAARTNTPEERKEQSLEHQAPRRSQREGKKKRKRKHGGRKKGNAAPANGRMQITAENP